MQPNTKKTLIIISLLLVTIVAFFILEQKDNRYLNNDCNTTDTDSENGQIDDIASNNKITNFDECAAAGNPIMESYPRQCRAGDQTFVEDISIKCTDDQRDAEFCITLYRPVCATVNIQCITAPCDPIKETFSNSCVACSNPLVDSYSPGEC